MAQEISAQSSSRPSSSASDERYDVFLSFNGKDTRHGFTSNLHHHLRVQKIRTFMDVELPEGKELDKLFDKIVKSSISIVVFSRNFASSTWCLRELVKILECKSTMGQEVLPVFYKVNPSQLRRGQGRTAEHLVRHMERGESLETIDIWRQAIVKLGRLKGWHFSPYPIHGGPSEVKFIRKIVKSIPSILESKRAADDDRLIPSSFHHRHRLPCAEDGNNNTDDSLRRGNQQVVVEVLEEDQSVPHVIMVSPICINALKQKWNKVIGPAAFREWKRIKDQGSGSDSIYMALESGTFWFPAQVYWVGSLSFYDAELLYDSTADKFQVRYPPWGRIKFPVERDVPWDGRIRAPPVDISPHGLHISPDDLRPGDPIEIQWREKKEFPYGWWYGVVGHLESCDGKEIYCLCRSSDTVVVEFNQYTSNHIYRRIRIIRKNKAEQGNKVDGFYGGIWKLRSDTEIATWKPLVDNIMHTSSIQTEEDNIKGCRKQRTTRKKAN